MPSRDLKINIDGNPAGFIAATKASTKGAKDLEAALKRQAAQATAWGDKLTAVATSADRMRRRLELATRKLPDIEINADSSEAEKKFVVLRKQLENLSKKRIGIDVDAGAAAAEIHQIKTDLAKLSIDNPEIKVNAEIIGALAGLKTIEREARSLDRLTATVDVDVKGGAAATAAVSSLDGAISTLGAAGPLKIGMIGAAIAALPAIGAATSGALTVGLGGALIGLGLAASKGSKQAKNAIEDLKEFAKREAAMIGQPFEGVWVEIVRIAEREMRSLGPVVRDALDQVAPDLTRFVDQAGAAFGDLGGELATAAQQAISSLLQSLGPELPKILGDIGNGIKSILDAASENPEAIVALIKGLAQLIDYGGRLIGILTNVAGWITENFEAFSTIATILSPANAALFLFSDAADVATQQVGPLTTVTTNLGAAAGAAVASTDDLATAQGVLNGKFGVGKTAADKYKTAIDNISGANLDAIDAEINYQAAVDDATKALKENGRSHDTNTAKGRANMENLKHIAETGKDYVDSLIAQKAPMSQVNALVGQQRDAFIKQAKAIGFSTSDAKKLATALGLLPAKKTPKVSADGAKQAKNDVDAVRIAMNNLPKGRTVTITTAHVNTYYDRRSGVNPGLRAAGGYISGPGTGTSDSIPTMLSNGEFVMTAKATSVNRPLLEYLNAQQYAQGGIVGYASGGPVISTRLPTAPFTRPGAGATQNAFAGSGNGAGVPLDDFVTRYLGDSVNVTSADVKKEQDNRTAQLKQLRDAEKKLKEDRKDHKSARTIADDEARIAKERRDLEIATRKLSTAESAYKKAHQTPSATLGASLDLGIKNVEAFMRNLTTIADKGFPELAQSLLSMGGPEAEKYAADAAKLSTSKLGALNTQVKRAASDQAMLAQMPAIISIKDALKHGAKGVASIMSYTGLSEDELAQANEVGHLFAAGGVMTYASGGMRPAPGIATRPTVLFGEGRYPEAYIPFDPQYRARAQGLVGQVAGQLGMTGTNINITVQGAIDPIGTARTLDKVMSKLYRTNGRVSTNVQVRR